MCWYKSRNLSCKIIFIEPLTIQIHQAPLRISCSVSDSSCILHTPSHALPQQGTQCFLHVDPMLSAAGCTDRQTIHVDKAAWIFTGSNVVLLLCPLTLKLREWQESSLSSGTCFLPYKLNVRDHVPSELHRYKMRSLNGRQCRDTS